jgi:molybdopterin synthase sulfur carrier subunit
MAWLRARDAAHAAAFVNPRVIRAAVNHVFAGPDTALVAGDEVAFFPPVTGG